MRRGFVQAGVLLLRAVRPGPEAQPAVGERVAPVRLAVGLGDQAERAGLGALVEVGGEQVAAARRRDVRGHGAVGGQLDRAALLKLVEAVLARAGPLHVQDRGPPIPIRGQQVDLAVQRRRAFRVGHDPALGVDDGQPVLGQRPFERLERGRQQAPGLHQTDWSLPKTEVGYWLRTSDVGKGYASEGGRAALQFSPRRRPPARGTFAG